MCFDRTHVNLRDSSFDPTPSRVICSGDSRAEHLQYIRTRPWRDDVVTGGVVVRGPWSGRGVTGTLVNTLKKRHIHKRGSGAAGCETTAKDTVDNEAVSRNLQPWRFLFFFLSWPGSPPQLFTSNPCLTTLLQNCKQT